MTRIRSTFTAVRTANCTMDSYLSQDESISQPVRVSQRFVVDVEADDILSTSEGFSTHLALSARTRPTRTEKNVWHVIEEGNCANSSGRFRRLLHTTASRKPEKYPREARAHKIELNLHQFQSETGDSLGEDADGWARLTF